ncbi:A-kinase anchor protein 17A isoform X1 [Pieris napi]|uniref:A-kinase anchor protein 17A isoform X1 n=2 Tax=Pieris napi TaxID=78633 RepID=UPI001FBA0107|nr:A-kinase anchor protein 17A isoform X1 [Pieris napi]
MSIQVCRDTSDAVALYLPQRLYLKPFAKINVSVQLPTHKVHGKSISNWELMEKLRKMIQPDSFSMLKVSKHSSEVIRFDGELENRLKLERVIARLEDRIIQLNDFPEPLKVRVCEAKSEFPSRHAWDSFFRDATDMDEMKPGERPDTIHIANLPRRWFVHDRDRNEDSPPSEKLFKKVFEKYGDIRQVDVPAADPFRLQMKESMRGILTPPQDSALYFEGYIQYSEYVSFVRCMDALRGKKLLRKNEDLADWCNILVDFDKTKHMTDAAVKRRAIVRERLSSRQRVKDDEERQEKERKAIIEAKERQQIERNEKDKLEKTREREERRKKKQLAKLMEREDVDLNKKVSEEQKKLLKVQKKLQAIRLIEELFKRIELRPELQRNGSRDQRYYHASERAARSRIVDKFKRKQEKILDEQQDLLRHARDGRILIRSALETKKPRRESASSLSSEDLNHKRVKTEKLTSPERDEYKAVPGMYPNPYGYGYPFVPAPGYPFPQTSMYYPVRGAYYPPPDGYAPRRGYRGRGRGRGRARLPHFDGPHATQQYYEYFKKLSEAESRNEHDDRARSRSRRRSYSRSRSRSRSRRRSYSRSRSRSRRSRSRRSRSRSRRSRSRSRRSRSHRSRTPSRSRRSRSHSRRRSKTRSKTKHRTPTPKKDRTPERNLVSPRRSKSWSMPKEGEN